MRYCSAHVPPADATNRCHDSATRTRSSGWTVSSQPLPCQTRSCWPVISSQRSLITTAVPSALYDQTASGIAPITAASSAAAATASSVASTRSVTSETSSEKPHTTPAARSGMYDSRTWRRRPFASTSVDSWNWGSPSSSTAAMIGSISA